MNSLQSFLEDFSVAPVAVANPAMGALTEDIESIKLDSFETGYKAGWEDAAKSQSDDRTRISSGFGQHLQDLSFTYHEAYAQVMNAMAPLLEDMVSILLPDAARSSLSAHIVDQLTEHAREIGEMEVVIAVNPRNAEAIQPLLEQDFGFPVSLTQDDTLAEEQADLRFANTEKQIDLTEALNAINEAIKGFAYENKRKVSNG